MNSTKSQARLNLSLLVAAMAIGGLIRASAADATAVNPDGAWKFSYVDSAKSQSVNSGKTPTFHPTLKFKLAGGNWSGTLSRRRGQQDIEMPLQDIKLAGNELTFTLVNTTESSNGSSPNMVRKFHGTIAGDTMSGTVQVDWGDQHFSREWEAKRLRP